MWAELVIGFCGRVTSPTHGPQAGQRETNTRLQQQDYYVGAAAPVETCKSGIYSATAISFRCAFRQPVKKSLLRLEVALDRGRDVLRKVLHESGTVEHIAI